MKHLTSTQNGFTLIELLVVIALVGIFSSVALASFNIQLSQLAENFRTRDGTYTAISWGSPLGPDSTLYQTGGSYECADHTFPTPTMKQICNEIEKNFDGVATFSDGGAEGTLSYYMFINKNINDTDFAIIANLRSSDRDWFCVDSTGTRKIVNTPQYSISSCP